jgi:glycerol-3-phosphate dehydrogenase
VAEVLWAVRKEMAFTVEDVLARRVRLLFVDAREAQKAAPRVAQIMAQEMGKDEKWIEEQIAKFNKVSDNYIVVKQ